MQVTVKMTNFRGRTIHSITQVNQPAEKAMTLAQIKQKKASTCEREGFFSNRLLYSGDGASSLRPRFKFNEDVGVMGTVSNYGSMENSEVFSMSL